MMVNCINCGNPMMIIGNDVENPLCEKCRNSNPLSGSEWDTSTTSNTKSKVFDDVDNPRHYTDKGIEPKDYIFDTVADPVSYCIGTVIKYISRFDRKEDPLKDLKKARVFLNWAIELVEDSNKGVRK